MCNTVLADRLAPAHVVHVHPLTRDSTPSAEHYVGIAEA